MNNKWIEQKVNKNMNEGITGLMSLVSDKPIVGVIGGAGSVGSAILTWCGFISAVFGAIGAVIGAVVACFALYDLLKKRGWIGGKK